MARGRVSSNHGPRIKGPKASVARVLEVRRIRERSKQHCPRANGTRSGCKIQQAEEGAILKREWWMKYTEDENIPQLQHVIQSYDTAFTKKETADYSAITTWGIFYPS